MPNTHTQPFFSHLCLSPLFVYDDDFLMGQKCLIPLGRPTTTMRNLTTKPRSVSAVCMVAALTVSLTACDVTPGRCAPPTPINLLPAVQDMAKQLSDFTALEVSGSVTLSPTLADFAANRLTVPGALRLNLHTKGVDGAQVFVSKLPGSSLGPAQIQVRLQGTKEYVTPAVIPSLVATVSGAHPTGTSLQLDAQVTNLRHLSGNGNGQRARYSELLVFTVVPE